MELFTFQSVVSIELSLSELLPAFTIDLAINLLMFLLLLFISIFSLKTFRGLKKTPTQSSGSANLAPILKQNLNLLNVLEHKFDESLDGMIENQVSHQSSLDQILRELRSETQKMEKQINLIDSTQNSVLSEIKALPKPSSYIRFPEEYQMVYDDLNKRSKEIISRAQNINNTYDVIVFQPILSFIISELQDISIAQAPMENIAGRLAVIERLLNCLASSFDKPEIIRRMKALKEEGFSDRLELPY
jgi:hypothetical protein